MNENPPSNPEQPQRTAVKVPESLATGAYATSMVVTHGREEFVLDFLATFAPPPRLASRVLLSPPHAKRLANALRENVGLYEKGFGALPLPNAQQAAHTVQARDFYSSLQIADAQLAGAYSNNVMIRHSREEFVMDFLASFPPAAIVVARILVSPPHILRVTNALEARIRIYEDAFGKIGELPPPPETPDSPDSGPRFKIL